MERFAGLRYPVHKEVHKSLDVAFPDLFRMPEFKKLKLKPNWEKIVRYICYLYDPKTDLIQEFQNDLKERKEAAATEAGYVRGSNGKWPDDLNKVMNIKDEDAYKAIMAFLRGFKNHEWVDIVVTEQEMYEFQSLRFQPIDDKLDDIYGDAKKKDVLMDAVNKRRESLKILYGQFYGEHTDLINAEFTEMVTPENAERIVAAIPPPYEEVKPEAVDVPGN